MISQYQVPVWVTVLLFNNTWLVVSILINIMVSMISISCFCLVRPHESQCLCVSKDTREKAKKGERQEDTERKRFPNREQTAHMLLPWQHVQVSFPNEQTREGGKKETCSLNPNINISNLFLFDTAMIWFNHCYDIKLLFFI